MKILHCILSSTYIDNANYQENALPRQNKLDGHQVFIIASTETIINNELSYISPSDYFNEDGIRVVRVPYKNIICHYISKKMRYYKGVYKLIENFKPDVILFHGGGAGELNTIIKYKTRYEKTKLYIDFHADKYNSGLNFFSKYIFTRMFYKYFITKSYKYVEKYLYITDEVKEYINDNYHINEDKMYFFPLGGNIISYKDKIINKKLIKQINLIPQNSLIIMHSGRLNKLKKTTDLLDVFLELNDEKIFLIIIGAFSDDVKAECLFKISKSNNIKFLGWKKSDELIKYLSASDLYMQPGDQSATMQNAICAGCPVAVYPYPSYLSLLKDSAFYLKDKNDIKKLLLDISVNRDKLVIMKEKSNKLAFEILDYKKITEILYQ